MSPFILLYLFLGSRALSPEQEAELYLSGIEGLELQETNEGRWQLKGEIERASDLKRIQSYLKKNPGILNRTDLSAEAALQIEKSLEKRLKFLAPEARLERKGGQFFVLGTESIRTVEELQKIYPFVSLGRRERPSQGLIQPTVFLELVLIEVKKSALKHLGTRISSPIGVQTNLGFEFLQSSRRSVGVSSDPIRGFLDLAIQNGEAKVHAKQSVISENGKTGFFQVGGEFPIKLVSGLVSKVEFKDYGLSLKFTPHLHGAAMVHLEIDSEISEIDPGSSVDGIPSILKKSLRTQIFARLDEMMAIGGIVRNSQSTFRDQIPGLASIPILGRLFESDDFRRHRSEAYLFITPRRMAEAWLPSPEL